MTRFTARFDDDVMDELKDISRITGQSMNTVLNVAVRECYQHYGVDPKVKATLEELKNAEAYLMSLKEKLSSL